MPILPTITLYPSMNYEPEPALRNRNEINYVLSAQGETHCFQFRFFAKCIENRWFSNLNFMSRFVLLSFIYGHAYSWLSNEHRENQASDPINFLRWAWRQWWPISRWRNVNSHPWLSFVRSLIFHFLTWYIMLAHWLMGAFTSVNSLGRLHCGPRLWWFEYITVAS